MKAISLNVKNKLFTLPAKLMTLLDFDPTRLIVQREGDDEIGIYYIDYDADPFYLVVDDLKGYFAKRDEEKGKYVTMIFTSESQKMMYTRVWEEIKKLINKVAGNKLGSYNKDYGVIRLNLMACCLLGICVRFVL